MMDNISYNLENDLKNMVGAENVHLNADMGKYTTFRAGGQAKYLVEPDSVDKLSNTVKYLKEHKVNYYIIGNGSNLLVRDTGFDGVIVKIGTKMSDIKVEDNLITAEAGAFLSKVAATACDKALAGMEFAAGIPGLIGGAVAMNAGAYGGEFKDIIKKVWLLDENGDEIILENNQMEFGYRASVVQKKGYVVVKASIELKPGNKEEISGKMAELMKARQDKQPLNYPSAGSTFKRPEGYFAGKLIMDAGLAGFSVGGASVSKKHCGFVINENNATATDIIKLMEEVSRIVYEKNGVTLEPEVKIIG